MIAWVDLETTGLDEKECSILEIAMVVTDDELNVIDQKHMVMRPIFLTLEKMCDYVREMHTHNGLLAECAQETTLRRYEVEQLFVDWLTPILGEAVGKIPLAGSTIGFDRVFLRDHMPKLYAMFHYRSIDVTTLNELASRWMPKVHNKRPRGDNNHRALPDILGSLETLKYYRGIKED